MILHTAIHVAKYDLQRFLATYREALITGEASRTVVEQVQAPKEDVHVTIGINVAKCKPPPPIVGLR